MAKTRRYAELEICIGYFGLYVQGFRVICINSCNDEYDGF
jgi:hypothetical protein